MIGSLSNCTFLCGGCTTTTCTGDKNFFNSFFNLRYSPLEFNSRKDRQHLTNWMAWNNSNNPWNSVNSLFKGRFRQRRRWLGSYYLKSFAPELAYFNLCGMKIVKRTTCCNNCVKIKGRWVWTTWRRPSFEYKCISLFSVFSYIFTGIWQQRNCSQIVFFMRVIVT